MESVGDVLKRQPSRFHYQDLVQKIMKDPDVAAFIQQESLTPEELNRSIPSLISTSPSVTNFSVEIRIILPKVTSLFWL